MDIGDDSLPHCNREIQTTTTAKMPSTPTKTTQRAEWDTPMRARAVPLFDIGLSTDRLFKKKPEYCS
jgi:hypothetical protein